MKIKISLFSVFIFVFISQNIFAEKVVVNNTLDLLNAIKSDCEIVIEEGYYNISKVWENVDNQSISWVDEFDGPGPFIYGINNLKLSGKGKVEIVIEPRYSWVMSFSNCTNIDFENIILGHTDSGYCTGGVLSFEECNNINIKNCSLFGSGTVGIYTFNCNNVLIEKSDIYECTYGLAYIYNSNNIVFEKTKLRKTGEYNLIEISESSNIEFIKCNFEENFNGTFMPYLFAIDFDFYSNNNSNQQASQTKKIKIHKCQFNNNKVVEFTNDVNAIDLKSNKYKGNDFTQPE